MMSNIFKRYKDEKELNEVLRYKERGVTSLFNKPEHENIYSVMGFKAVTTEHYR